MAKLLVLHGPNLNLLGTREPGVYGRTTLDEIDADLTARALEKGHELSSFQSNAEHALVDRVQAARDDGTDFILINPAGLTHSSEEHTSELQSLMRISYAVFCLTKKN